MVHQEQFTFDSTGHRHMADVTDQVTAIVGRSGVRTGIVQVFSVGSTAAVGAIEFEPGLQRAERNEPGANRSELRAEKAVRKRPRGFGPGRPRRSC